VPPEHFFFPVVMSLLVFVLSFLMISKIKYRSFKDLNVRAKKSYIAVFVFAFVFSIIALWPTKSIAVLSYAYMLSGPFSELKHLLKKKVPVMEENEQRI